MNNFKYTEPKEYALTEGKEYTPTKTTEDYLYITNDNGKKVKYLKELFDEVLPEPVVRTEQEMIDSIEYHNLSKKIKFNGHGDDVIEINVCLAEQISAISCGILQIFNIAELMNNINNALDFDDGERIELKKKLLESAIFNYIIENASDHAIAIMSTNLEDEEEIEEWEIDDELIQHLTEISHFNTEIVNNPNSGNIIQMWGFYYDKLN